MSVNQKFSQRDIALDKLVLNPDNLRFKGGTAVDGINVQDTYNLGTMKDVIKAEGNIPGRLVVEEQANGTFVVLAGNRRTAAAKELVADGTTAVELAETLAKLPCNVYKDLNDRARRDLINDQRSQKYMRSELVAYIWRLQMSGMSFPEIADHVWMQMATYAAGGARKIADVERCKTDAERKKEITTWLKGTVDNVILACGKLGPRVRRALLLYEMSIDGISPVLGKDEKDQPIYESCEFKPSQGRCGELRKAQKNDPNWTATAGGAEFNALINKYIREDKGLDENGEPIPDSPTRPTAERLIDQKNLTKSNAGKVAIDFARGLKVLHYADVDDEAYRVERLQEIALKLRDGIKNDLVKQCVQMFLTGKPDELELFLTGLS